MNQITVTNGVKHTHTDRPFAPPHESPLEREAKQNFGCTSQQVRDRVDRCEQSVVVQLGAVLDVLRDVVPADTGETDEVIINSAIARAFVRFGGAGMFIQLAGPNNIQAGKEFGQLLKHDVINMLARKFC